MTGIFYHGDTKALSFFNLPASVPQWFGFGLMI